jgi:hypothetical protein
MIVTYPKDKKLWKNYLYSIFIESPISVFILYFCYDPFFSQFRGIQLVVTVLSHHCNSRTDSGEMYILRNTTQPSRTASWHNAHLTRKPAAPMCRRKHRAPGDCDSMHCARPATGFASAQWDKDIPAGQTFP